MEPIIITPESELERRIVEDPRFQESLDYQYSPRQNRPESSLGAHVANLLKFIDQVGVPSKLREELRLLSLLHDYGKCETVYDHEGRRVGPTHSELSESFARDFVQEKRILKTVRLHDKHFSFYRKLPKRFKEGRFIECFREVDLDLMIPFNYVDVCEREKDSVVWFDETCFRLDLTQQRTRDTYPQLLNHYSA